MKNNNVFPSFVRIAAVSFFLLGIAAAASAQTGPYQFYALTPCRVVDTRGATGVNGGPALTTTRRDFQIRGFCGVPTTAKAVSLNVTVTNATAFSWLTLWPAGQAPPPVSTINFDANVSALANGAIVGVSTATHDLSVTNANGTVHVILDVTGYFQ
jgi:hypothetical protein